MPEQFMDRGLDPRGPKGLAAAKDPPVKGPPERGPPEHAPDVKESGASADQVSDGTSTDNPPADPAACAFAGSGNGVNLTASVSNSGPGTCCPVTKEISRFDDGAIARLPSG